MVKGGSKKGGGRKGAAKKLTPRQEKFVEGVLQHGNATKAAKEAGYSAKTARSIANENLTKPDILNRIKERQADARIETDEIIGTLASQMRGDMGDIVPENPIVAKAKRVGLSHLIKKLIVKKYYDKHLETTVEETTFELHSSQTAAKQLCSVFGLNKEEGKNPDDERVRVEKAITAFIARTGASREEAVRNLAPFMPEVSAYAN